MLLFSIVVIIYSCRKDQSATMMVDNAKTWYTSLNKGKSISLNAAGHDSLKILQDIKWNVARGFKLNNGDNMIRVPMEVSSNNGQKIDGSFILLILKSGNAYSSKVLFNNQPNYFNSSVSDNEIEKSYFNGLRLAKEKLLGNRNKCYKWGI